MRANLTDSGFKFERINLRKNLEQSKFGAKFAALKLLYKVANLSENFKKWLKIDLVSATTANLTFVRLKSVSEGLNLIHGFCFTAALNLTQILRAFAPIKIILSKK